jgi:hypothetical protein
VVANVLILPYGPHCIPTTYTMNENMRPHYPPSCFTPLTVPPLLGLLMNAPNAVSLTRSPCSATCCVQMDTWGVDVVLTAPQKALGSLPGLSIVVASERALRVGSDPVRSVLHSLTHRTACLSVCLLPSRF